MDSPGEEQRFLTTRWSLVRAAGGAGASARESLGVLCEGYWYPLYAYLRRKGAPHAEAQDTVQAFFLSLLERGDLSRPTAERGRFRNWLLTALHNHCANARERETTLKRGGGRPPLSIDWQDGERRFEAEPQSSHTPESTFNRAWALACLERGKARLAAEYSERGKEMLGRQLLPCLGEGPHDREELSRTLGLREGALKVAIHRFRQRFAEALRTEIASTLGEDEDVDEELARLMAALSGQA